MSRSLVVRKHFKLNEQCFPRIFYFKTRLRRIFPRLKNILSFEFSHQNRGLESTTSDDEELKSIGAEIPDEMEHIEIECFAFDDKLLQNISEAEIVINQNFLPKTETGLIQHDGRHPEDKANTVNIIAVQPKDLPELLKLTTEVKWIKHTIIAVFAGRNDKYEEYLEAAKNESLEVVLIAPEDRNKTQGKSRVLSEPSESSSMKESSLPKASSSASPRSLTLDLSQNRRLLLPSQTSPATSSETETLTSPVFPAAAKNHTLPSPAYQLHKKSKFDTDDFSKTIYRRQGRQAHMEIDERERYQQSSGESIHWNTDELRQTVSFHLEIRTVRVLERIITLLKNLKARRNASANVPAVTTLDKLLYEIEGLLSQSITEHGIKMKEDIEKERLSPKLRADLLRVHGVYGCGTCYARLNIHIEVNEGDDTETIKEEIKKVTANYNYKNTDYEVFVVKSRPTMYGTMVICSA